MPQTNIAIPISREQSGISEYFASRKNDDLGIDIKHEPKFRQQRTSHSDVPFCSHVIENDSSDSGFGTGSDEEDRFNSGLSSIEDIFEPPSEPKLVSQRKDHSDGQFCCKVKDSSDSGTSSYEENRLNSGFSSVDDCDLNIITSRAVLNTTDSFDFWNKTHIEAKDIKHQCIKNSSDKNSIVNLTSNCSEPSFNDVGSFLNSLSSNVDEKYSDYESKIVSSVDNYDALSQINQKTLNGSDSVLNFKELLNDISNEKENKIGKPVTLQNSFSSEKTHKNAFPLNKKCSNPSDNLFPNFDNAYSDLFTSLCLDKSCNDDSSKLNSAVDTKNNDINSNKLKNFSTCSFENDESLSDLLASVCVESNINEKDKTSFVDTSSVDGLIKAKANDIDTNEISLSSLADEYLCGFSSNNEKNKNSFADTVSNNTGLINAKSNDIDTNEISLASLAETYLSSNVSNTFLSSFQKDDCIDLSENNTLNLEKTSETNPNPFNEDNSQESFDLCDLFAAVNKNQDNPDKIFLRDITNDLLLKSESNNLRSQTTYSSNKDAVALFAEKYIHNDESSDDEIDGNPEIDLTSCLKSDKLQSSSSKSLNIASDTFVQEANVDTSILHSSPTMLMMNNAREVYSPHLKSKITNSKQSLFAKALSCKPKKDKSEILKVLSVQRNFCEHLFNPPRLAINMKPIKQTVCPANDFVFSTLGRRTFERGKFSEIK